MKLLILLLYLVGCSSIDSLPPDQETAQKLLDDSLNRPLKIEEVWFDRYSKGLDLRPDQDFKGACELFEFFDSDSEFPLTSLANLYAIDSCSRHSKTFPLDRIKKLESNFPTGFKKEFFQVTYDLADLYAEPDTIVEYALKLAREKSLRSEKEALLLKAFKKESSSELKAQAEAALFKFSPRFHNKPFQAIYPDIARDYERARDFTKAITWYKKILKEDPLKDFDRWFSAAKRYRQLFKNMRDKDTYLKETNTLKKHLEKLVKKDRSDKTVDALAEIMVDEARAEWTQNRRTRADSILKKAQEFLPTMSSNMKALISWIRGMISLEAKNHIEAKKLFREAIDLEPSNKKVMDDASWNLAWTMYLDKDYAEFIDFVNEVHSKLSEDLDEKLTFWLGKAHYKQRNIKAALDIWSELYKKSPYNYYGLMAHASSGASFNSIAVSLDETPRSSEVEWLASLKQFDLCKDYLEDWRQSRRSDQAKKEWLASFVKCHHAAGAIRLYYSHSKASDSSFMTENLAALFPLSFKNDVFKAADRFSIDAYLMQSIIRQESAFNPEARSPADAFGLMQLIPELAKRLSKQHKVDYSNFDDLYDPAKNVTLGAAYLSELDERMTKRKVGVIAAYNAGTGPIFNWYKNRSRKDVFEFIEGIAYEETRNYVKLVLRNWIIYQQLEKTANFNLDLNDLH